MRTLPVVALAILALSTASYARNSWLMGGNVGSLPPYYSTDYTGSIDTCWTFNDSSDRTADTCTGATLTNALSAQNSPSYGSSGNVDGDYAILDGVNDYFTSSDSLFNITGSGAKYTIWCWTYSTNASISDDESIIGRFNGNSDGYVLEVESSNGADYRSVKENRNAITNGTQYAKDRWTFVAGRSDSAAADDKTWVGVLYGTTGAESGWNGTDTAGTSSTLSDASNNFHIGAEDSPAAAFWEGRVDGCGFTTAEIDDESLCRICACGENGKFCECETAGSSAYKTGGLASGRAATMCGNCPLPGCSDVMSTL